MSGKPGEIAVSLAKRKSLSSCKPVPADPVTSIVSVDNGGVRTVVEKGMPERKTSGKRSEKKGVS